MGLLKIIFFVFAIAFIAGAIRSFLSQRGKNHRLPPEGGNNSIAEEIYKLDELRRRGIITQDEFERQKRKLLDE